MINKNFGGLFQRKSEKLFLNIIDNFILLNFNYKKIKIIRTIFRKIKY